MKTLPTSIAIASTIILAAAGDVLVETQFGAWLVVLLAIGFLGYAANEIRKS